MKQVLVLLMFLAVLLVVISCEKARTAPAFISKEKKTKTVVKDSIVKESITTTIDTVDYNQRLWALSNQDASGRWPFKTVYPLAGVILPYHRIVAFYGNLYSKRMGVLGALPKQQMLQKLNYEVNRWHKADPFCNHHSCIALYCYYCPKYSREKQHPSVANAAPPN